MPDTPAERRAHWASVGFIKGGRTKPIEKIITRPEDGSVDAGRKAVRVINEERDIVLTRSDNRQDVNVIGKAADVCGDSGTVG